MLADTQTVPLQIKDGLYPFTTLQVLSVNLKELSEQLERKLKQAPKFFDEAAIIVDLSKLSDTIDLSALLAMLKEHHLAIAAVRTNNMQLRELCKSLFIPLITNSSSKPPAPKLVTDHEVTTTQQPQSPNQLVTSPIRSGQQVYNRHGDLTVTATASQGSELLASGNIHVYGTLRGKALAGVNGDNKTHIFCKSLEAELISIAGQYLISEDIDSKFWQQSVDIYLDDKDNLQIKLI